MNQLIKTIKEQPTHKRMTLRFNEEKNARIEKKQKSRNKNKSEQRRNTMLRIKL